jgi:phage gp36-like protein
VGYATVPDLVKYGLASGTLDGDLDAGQQLDALNAASTFADGYLRSQYTLPLIAPYPADLVEAVCKIAAYNLLSVRGLNPELGADQNYRDRYKDALAWLTEVGMGHISPSILDSSPGQNPIGPYVTQAYTDPDTTNPDGSLITLTRKPSARGWV